MISAAELNPHNYPTTPEIDSNLATLLVAINVVRAAWGSPMTVTSGLRSQADQLRINPSAPKSKHLIGAACDILDSDKSLQAWVLANVSIMEEAGLWMEDFRSTPDWVHFQCIPPGSGHRFFIP